MKFGTAISALFCILSNMVWAEGLMERGKWNYDIFMAGKKVGNSFITATAIGDDRLETTSKIHFEVTRGSQNIAVDGDARTVYSWPSGKPVSYDLTLTSGRVPTIFTGIFKDKEVIIQVKSGPQEYENQITLDGGEFLLDNNFLIEHYLVMLDANRMETGEARTVRFLVPQIAQRFPKVFQMQLKNAGIQNPSAPGGTGTLVLWEGTSDTGLKMEFWIDPDSSQLVRWAVPSQLVEVVLTETPEDNAIDPVDLSQIYSHLLERYYIPTYLEMGNFLEVESLKTRIDICVIGDGLPENGNQNFNGEVVKNSSVLCYQGIMQTEMSQYDGEGSLEIRTEWGANEPYLKETIDFPSKSEEIASLAHQLTNDVENQWEAVKRIGQWIFENIQYEITGSGALECLKNRKGDCGPKSLLAISMLRSLGIPSRLVGGILYVGGKFGQHNWVEVEATPGKWVPFDPTTGEVERFSASHITLWHGMGALAPDARPMKVEVLAFSRSE